MFFTSAVLFVAKMILINLLLIFPPSEYSAFFAKSSLADAYFRNSQPDHVSEDLQTATNLLNKESPQQSEYSNAPIILIRWINFGLVGNIGCYYPFLSSLNIVDIYNVKEIRSEIKQANL